MARATEQCRSFGDGTYGKQVCQSLFGWDIATLQENNTCVTVNNLKNQHFDTVAGETNDKTLLVMANVMA